MLPNYHTRTAMVAMLALLLLASPASAQGGSTDRGWSFTARFSTVFTGGNSVSSTFGLNSGVKYAHDGYQVEVEAGAVRTESGIRTRRAVGSATDFVVDEQTVWEKTAEAYFVRARYDRKTSEQFILFAGMDWLRNTFSGIDSRYLVAIGAGNVWADTDRLRLVTDYGLTYTFQHDVVENPFVKTNFPGVRASWNLMRRFTTSTRFTSLLTADINIDNTDDLRADFRNSLSIAINKSLAFEPSLKLLWRNDPALKSIDLFTPAGTPTGDKVVAPLEKLDTFFTVALVVTL